MRLILMSQMLYIGSIDPSYDLVYLNLAWNFFRHPSYRQEKNSSSHSILSYTSKTFRNIESKLITKLRAYSARDSQLHEIGVIRSAAVN